MRGAVLGGVVLAGLVTLGGTPSRAQQTEQGVVTFYQEAGVTYGGTFTTAGRTAACGWGIPLWATVTLPDGASYVCEDRIGSPSSDFDVDVFGESDIPERMAPYCDRLCPIEVND